MKAEVWQRVREILDQAIATDVSERSLYLDQACNGDSELRSEVESLLRSHDDAGSVFLKNPAADLKAAVATAAAPAHGRIGRRIGAYEIVEEIGHGGMGEVYRAVRADGQFTQQVAIKLVRAGMDAPTILERFRNERQILASLDNPNIARLYDGGTTPDGIPYLVMELIEGTPIDEYCAKSRLEIPARLSLFLQICSAVQYAHQRLVIHRDIKPGNILVTAQGVPKLLDFGIAKILDRAAGTETTLLRPMTPEYASPEQIRGESITTASDVYSLGVVFYRLLTGRSPYPEKTRSPLEFAKAICELEPERPSTVFVKALRVADDTSAATLRTAAKSVKRRRALAGDLDNIVLKALRKESDRRYASAEQMVEDIRRHLAGLTVTATPDSVTYRAGKFVRRHTLAMTATGLILVAIAGGVAATLREARIAAANQRRAEKRFDDVRRLANSLMFEIHDSIQDLPGATGARRLLIARSLEYLDSLSHESGGDLSLERELAAAYARLGDLQVYRNGVDETTGAIASYQKAFSLRETIYASDPTKVNDAVALADSSRQMAEALMDNGDPVAALPYSNRAVELNERLASAEPDNAKVLQELAHDYANQANVLGGDLDWSNLGDNRAALAVRRKQLEVATRVASLQPDTPAEKRRMADAMIMLGDQLLMNGERHSARTQYLQAQQLMESLFGHVESAQLLNDSDALFQRFAIAALESGDLNGAKAACRKALDNSERLAKADPQNIWALVMLAEDHARLAYVLSKSGRLKESLRLVDNALKDISEVARLNPNSMNVLGTQADVALIAAGIFLQSSQIAQAINHYQTAIDIYEGIEAKQSGNLGIRAYLAAAYNGLGAARAQHADINSAQEAYLRALRFGDSQGNSTPASVESLYSAANTYAGLGELETIRAGVAPNSTAEDHWKKAQHWYALSAKAWSLIKEPGFTTPKGFDAMPVRAVNEALARCTAALQRGPN